MAFRPRDLRWMVEESMTLSERLGGAVVPGGSGHSSGTAGERLRKWRDRVANGDAARFERRLRWDGLDVESALRLLGPVRLKDPYPLPDWIGLLEAAGTATGVDTPFDRAVAPRDVFDPHAPLPFEDLLWRLIPVAGRRLLTRLGGRRGRLARGALVDLARGLLGRVCRTAARTLCAEFDVFRALRPGRLALYPGESSNPGRQLYRDFVRDVDGDGWPAWLLRYPMLGRLLATCCRQWIRAAVALVRRLDRDEDALRATFGIRDRPLEIAGVTPDLSDPHRDGQTVWAIRFGSGARLVYKPRRLALDRHFVDLLDRLADTRRDLTLKRPKLLDRGDYGWVEWIDAAPCPDPASVERFYRRAGMLTCLAYVLGASDLHAGNIIASGDQPVPIDLECLTGAPLASPARDAAEPALGASLPGSVFRTGLLPVARRGADGVFRIAGGLADPNRRQADGRSVTNANTDWMAWRGGVAHREPETNVPLLDGRPRSASAHVEPLADGFRLMYRTLSRNKERLRATEAVRGLENEEFRVLIRDTRSYVSLLEDALSPRHVTSGPDWSIALDALVAPALTADERPRCWATRTAERVELERLDVPLFVGRLDHPVLRSPLEIRLDEQLDRTACAVSTRLGLLNADDLERQLHLLRTSFAIACVKRRYRERRARAARRRGGTRIRRQSLVEVHSIVALLKRLALDDGTAVTWRQLGGPSTGAARLAPVGIGLFSGTSGIALFLTTAALVTGRRDARELAARVLDPLCARLGDRTFPFDLAADVGIGGAAGLGGLIYALVHAGRSLGHPGYLAAARAAADGITRDAIGADRALDVLSGAAGALLGLLSLHRTTGDRTALRIATRCGEHILDSRAADSDTGLRAWRTLHDRITTGFAHGASGIGCALRRLANATGRDVFRAAAEEGWAVERRRLARRGAPEPERRSTTHDLPRAWPWSWCHGAAGTGLARLDALDDGDARSDVEAAVKNAPSRGTAEADGLCCGRMGRADFLFSAGIRLGRRDLREAAESIGRDTVASALAAGRYRIGTDEGFRPGLFQGAAGIGYQLLRLQAPNVVQSVLSWE